MRALSAAFVRTQRKKLEAELEGIPLRQRKALAAIPSETLGDDMDKTSEGIARDLQVAQLNGRAAAVREVIAALRRIDDGGYGICSECDVQIGQKRLLALPAASYCIACQNRQEVLQRSRSSR